MWGKPQNVSSLLLANEPPIFNFSRDTLSCASTSDISATFKYGVFKAVRQEPFHNSADSSTFFTCDSMQIKDIFGLFFEFFSFFSVDFFL